MDTATNIAAADLFQYSGARKMQAFAFCWLDCAKDARARMHTFRTLAFMMVALSGATLPSVAAARRRGARLFPFSVKGVGGKTPARLPGGSRRRRSMDRIRRAAANYLAAASI